ncbi:MAG: hypothetical protein ACLTXK_07390 [Megamonas funiformis]|jgi:hypothetical protein|uniref:hypothetical protein n=1 Tax=Megamonas funiformis TaxID=437897 RepID=UPI003994615D
MTKDKILQDVSNKFRYTDNLFDLNDYMKTTYNHDIFNDISYGEILESILDNAYGNLIYNAPCEKYEYRRADGSIIVCNEVDIVIEFFLDIESFKRLCKLYEEDEIIFWLYDWKKEFKDAKFFITNVKEL